MSLKEVAVVILNYNGRNYLEQFLPSVLKNSEDAQIIVADNGSTDDSVAFLKHEFPQVRLIEFSENHWFCGGYNKSLAQVDANYYVLLNSDVEVSENWIRPVIELMEGNEKIAACQPKVKVFADKTKFEYAGGAGGELDYLGYPLCRGRIFDVLEEDHGQYNDNKPVFWATGACMFVKASVYQEFQGLDEIYFAHMEEIDLCWRMQNAGYEVWYCGQSEVFHVGGGTLPKTSPRKTFLNFRNSLMLLFKNLPVWQLPLIIVRMILDGLSGIMFLSKGETGNFTAILKAHFSLYAHIPKLIARRKLAQATVKKHAKRLPISIVWQHFVKGIKYYSDLPISK